MSGSRIRSGSFYGKVGPYFIQGLFRQSFNRAWLVSFVPKTVIIDGPGRPAELLDSCFTPNKLVLPIGIVDEFLIQPGQKSLAVH